MEKQQFDYEPNFLTLEGDQVRICFDVEHTTEERNPIGGVEPVEVEVIKAYSVRISQPLTFSNIVDTLVRAFYTADEEFAIQRQKDDKPGDYNHYNAWVEKLKAIAHRVLEGDSLDTMKGIKIAELGIYDASPAVNSFTIGNEVTWLSPASRSNYLLTIQAAQAAGVEVVIFEGIQLPVASALAALNAINVYAMQCVGVTEAHKAAINALDTIEAVEAYDYTTGYPEKLNF